MAREFATTCQAILHHATERPHDDAIIDRRTIVSYLKLAQSIVQFTEALRELGIAPGDIVGVQNQNRLVHWLILFACERLGAASATLLPMQLNEQDALFRRAALDHRRHRHRTGNPDAAAIAPPPHGSPPRCSGQYPTWRSPRLRARPRPRRWSATR